MTVPSTTSSTTSSTTTNTPQPTLTGAQARALLRALLSTTPIPPHRSNPAAPKPTCPASRQQNIPTENPLRRPPQCHNTSLTQSQAHPPHQTQTITIDTSTRIMGHCNTITLSPSSSPTDQAAGIEELVRGVLAAYPPMKRGVGGVSINVQAGVSVVGSRNVVVFGAGAGAGGEKEGGKRKRGVEEVEAGETDRVDRPGKRVKVEGNI